MPMIDTSAFVEGFWNSPDPPVKPHTERAEDEVVAWLWKVGFLTTDAHERHLRSFEFGLYHGIATPHVSLASLALGLKWFCWGSLADDQYDNYDGSERELRMRRVLRGMREILDGASETKHPDNPVLAGFADFWPDLTAGLSPRGLRRITEHFDDYVHAVVLQNRYHAANRIPDEATFLALRRNTIAMIFQADILEIVSDIRVPDALRDSLLFRELVLCFADILAWHNDVYGLEKDIADGQTCNAVRVVAASEHCDLKEAVGRILERAKDRQRLFLEIERELPDLAASLDLPADAAAEAVRLARDLRAYAFANLIWIRKTQRYDLDLPRIEGTFDDVMSSQSVATGSHG